MYSDKLVIAVKHNGRVLRENGDTVHVPFGSEYSLLIKNKNSVRAKVKVEIDGTDVTEGVQLIVPANGSIDLERFIKNGNLSEGNRFKFIERTQRIENHRGVGVEDGLIRVEFEFERQIQTQYTNTVYTTNNILRDYIYSPRFVDPYVPKTGEIWCNATAGSMNIGAASAAELKQEYTSAVGNSKEEYVAQSLNDVGITVPGSISEQKFEHGAWFETDGVKHVMIMKLLGQVGDKRVEKPITSKMKKECPTCGAGNRASFKFCRECGTALTVL